MKKWMAMLLTAVLVLCCVAVAGAEEIEPLSREWFMQEDAVVPGRAHVEITFGTDTVYASSEGGWFYTVYLSEVNGVPFTVEEYAVSMFYEDEVFLDSIAESGDTFAQWMGSDTIRGFSQVSVRSGFPVQSLDGVAVIVRGHDANGVACSFKGYVALSAEVR